MQSVGDANLRPIPSDLAPDIYDLVIKAGNFTSTAGLTVAVK
jgi:hypothetical protein